MSQKLNIVETQIKITTFLYDIEPMEEILKCEPSHIVPQYCLATTFILTLVNLMDENGVVKRRKKK